MAVMPAPPPLFLVGTRFQAIMVRGILEHLQIASYDLVAYHQEGEIKPDDDFVFSNLIHGAQRVTRINRKQPTRKQFAALIRATGKHPRAVFMAHINMPFILALFRLRPNMRLRTFDEGGYNVAPDGPFHAPLPRKFRRLRDIVSFALFPKGPLHFAQQRTERHYTAFLPDKNVLSSKTEQIQLPWANFVHPDEADLARTAHRIMVLPCLKDFTGPPHAKQALISAASTCNVVIRHPRDGVLDDFASVRLRSPVEGIVCAAAEQRPVQVMHYASTVRLTLANKPNITLFDLG